MRNLSTWLLLILSALSFTLGAENQEQLNWLQKSIDELQKSLQKSGLEKEEIENELMLVELKVALLNSALRELGADIVQLEKKQIELQQQKATFQDGIESQLTELSLHLNAAYKMGAQEPVKLLLNQRDPSKFSRMLSYYTYFSQSRTKQIEAYEVNLRALDQVLIALDQQKIVLAQSKVNLAKNQNELLERKKQRETTLRKLHLSLASDQKKLDQWEKQRSRLQRLLSSVEESSREFILHDDYVSMLSRKGKLNWPVSGRLEKRFGNIRSGSLEWEGWLLGIEAGTPVSTVHQGRVVFSNYLRGFGLLIIVDHGDSYMSLYAHNQELLKDTGDWVDTGEILAHSGDSGGLNKPALYFEIRQNGKPRNPKQWLKSN
ncbi:MAG: hypothetical protein CMK42_07840 [Porticoccaceae bacterium]|nr:hypothetical protein [Porticoccaceae bacterium]